MAVLKLIVVVLLCVPFAAQASRVVVQDPCGDGAWAEVDVDHETPTDAGAVTVSGLDASGLPYEGTRSGISSIGGTPSGDAALEIISESEMRAYGWCYEVDGVAPSVYPDEVPVLSDSAKIYWYFGYAHYLDGQWVSYCTPTHVDPPDYVCPTGS